MKSTYRRAATKVRGPGSLRHAWLKLVEGARLIAGRADGTAWGSAKGELIADIARMRRDVRASEFPVHHASAVPMAEAFVRAIDAFSVASPDMRAEYAPALRELANVMWNLLENQRADDAQRSWMRQLPASEQL